MEEGIKGNWWNELRIIIFKGMKICGVDFKAAEFSYLFNEWILCSSHKVWSGVLHHGRRGLGADSNYSHCTQLAICYLQTKWQRHQGSKKTLNVDNGPRGLVTGEMQPPLHWHPTPAQLTFNILQVPFIYKLAVQSVHFKISQLPSTD